MEERPREEAAQRTHRALSMRWEPLVQRACALHSEQIPSFTSIFWKLSIPIVFQVWTGTEQYS